MVVRSLAYSECSRQGVEGMWVMCCGEGKNGGKSLGKVGSRLRFGRRGLVPGMGRLQGAWRVGLGFLVGGARVRCVAPHSQLRSGPPLEPDLSGGLPGLAWAPPGSGLGDSRVILSLPLPVRASLP